MIFKIMAKKIIVRNDSEHNDDWMKTLPGYKDEIKLHDDLAKNKENAKKSKIFKLKRKKNGEE